MTVVKVSSKFQVVIPEDVRKNTDIRPGQDVVVVAKGDIINVIPMRPIKEMKGILKGLSTENIRDEEDRF